MSTRVDYEDLTDEEREAIHAWCRTHNVDPKETPINPVIEHDATTDEWRIEQFARSNGSIRIDPTRDRVVTKFLRRVRKAELIWRRE